MFIQILLITPFYTKDQEQVTRFTYLRKHIERPLLRAVSILSRGMPRRHTETHATQNQVICSSCWMLMRDYEFAKKYTQGTGSLQGQRDIKGMEDREMLLRWGRIGGVVQSTWQRKKLKFANLKNPSFVSSFHALSLEEKKKPRGMPRC